MSYPIFTAKGQDIGSASSPLYIAGGLTTYWINGYNAGNQPLFPDTAHVFGGGIYGQQPGISLRAIYMLDTNRKYRVTLGGDYLFLSGGQRMEEKFFQLIGRHTMNILSLSGGFEYAFVTLPLANAKIYAGAEANCSFLENIEFQRRLYYKVFDTLIIQTPATKQSATRFGAAVRLGVEGELLDPLYVNMSIAYSAVNLFNRNDNRGELLTPQRIGEIKESIVGNIFFSFWLQYRL